MADPIRQHMTVHVAKELKPATPGATGKLVLVAAKLLVTGACFWYLSRQIDLRAVLSSIPRLEVHWAALAAFLAMLQIPFLAMRWREVLHVLAAIDRGKTKVSIIVITAIGDFFAQVL